MKTNVGVFFGGRTVEHEVAVISAVQAMTFIDRNKYDVTPVYITRDGKMYHSPCMTNMEEFKNIPELLKKSKEITFVKQNDRFTMIELKSGLFKKALCEVDIAFPIVHGTNCEDGSIVGWFELLGVPYVTCDVVSAAVGMDKELFKCVLLQKGIPTLPCVSFYAKQWVNENEQILKEIGEKIEYPMIVKPANLGSSVGIRKVEDENELCDAIEYAMEFATKILVEHAVENLRELNCSVLGDHDECETSVIEEPVMSGKILSYADKYQKGGKGSKGAKNGGKTGESSGMASLDRIIPAQIPEHIQKAVEEYSKKTFTALGCNGVVRIDYLYDTAKDCVYVNEINTIPGSLSFYLWEPKGVKYTEQLTKMIELGFKRDRVKNNLSFSYETNILSNAGSFGTKETKGKI